MSMPPIPATATKQELRGMMLSGILEAMETTPKPYVTLSLRFTLEEHARLRAESYQTQMPMAEIVRQAVRSRGEVRPERIIDKPRPRGKGEGRRAKGEKRDGEG